MSSRKRSVLTGRGDIGPIQINALMQSLHCTRRRALVSREAVALCPTRHLRPPEVLLRTSSTMANCGLPLRAMPSSTEMALMISAKYGGMRKGNLKVMSARSAASSCVHCRGRALKVALCGIRVTASATPALFGQSARRLWQHLVEPRMHRFKSSAHDEKLRAQHSLESSVTTHLQRQAFSYAFQQLCFGKTPLYASTSCAGCGGQVCVASRCGGRVLVGGMVKEVWGRGRAWGSKGTRVRQQPVGSKGARERGRRREDGDSVEVREGQLRDS